MNLKEIREMISLMNDNQLTELEVEREGSKIRLKKGSAGVTTEHMIPTVSVPAAVPQAPAAPAAEPSPAASCGLEIKAPMVGTFYRAPSPDAPPFVEVGQEIEIGQVVCIIEAMKLMNEIKAEVRGKISKICVENADAIEYGEVLFMVDPLG